MKTNLNFKIDIDMISRFEELPRLKLKNTKNFE